MEKKIDYRKLSNIANGYFIAIGVLWLAAGFIFGGGFIIWAFLMILVFGAQAYFKKKLGNLILGIITLACSIFWALEFTALGKVGSYDAFVIIMLGICIVSIIFSFVLLFSYTKLSFAGDQ